MNNRNVFLCDDDDGVRSSISFLLRQHGLRVVPLSGLQVHEALVSRGMGDRMPVLFLSGHGDIPMAVGAMARGAFHFVEKPYANDALVQLIHKALAAEEQWHARMERHDRLQDLMSSLSRQQVRLMPLVAAGELNKTIAWKMELSIRTVEEHRRKIFDRLSVHSAAELATLLAEARAAGIAIPTGDEPT